MKRRIAYVVGLLVVVLSLAGCGHFLPSQGWIALIDGASGLDNWDNTNGGNWRSEDGAIVGDKKTGKAASVLVSKRSFKDFELYAEVWAADETNSGIYIRAMNPKQVTTATGAYEVQIWDKNPNPAYSTGSLVNVASVQPIHKAGGRWNTFEIYAKGAEIVVKFNGQVTAHANDGRFPEGRIGVQLNSGPVKVRKLLVKPL